VNVTTLHQVEESLRKLDVESLREMAYQTARGHVKFCELTSQLGGCPHVQADEVRKRVDGLTVGQLAGMLAPAVWTSMDLQMRIVE
jgi:hypothetical protein